MEKRKAIVFAAIAIAVLVSAMSMGCVKEAEKDEGKVAEGIKEGEEKVVEVVDNVSEDIKEEGEKVVEVVDNVSEDIKEEGEKVVEVVDNVSEDIKNRGVNDSAVL